MAATKAIVVVSVSLIMIGAAWALYRFSNDIEQSIMAITQPDLSIGWLSPVAWVALRTASFDPNGPTGNPCQTLLQFTLAGHVTESTLDNAEQIERVADLLLDRGADVNFQLCGLNALTHAVVLNDAWSVAYLLQQGADPSLRMSRSGSPIDGMNAIELAEYLFHQEQYHGSRDEIIVLLKGRSDSSR